MTRQTHYDGEWMAPEEARRRRALKEHNMSARADLPCPMIMSDIQPYRSMIDGRMITSRSEHRQHLREHGCFELGNESPYTPPPPPDPNEIKREIKESIEKVKAGYIPPEGPTHDSDGNPIEEPPIADVVVGGDVETGSYVRSEATSDPNGLII